MRYQTVSDCLERGEALYHRGEFAEAEQLFRDGLALCGDAPQWRTMCLMSLGGCLRELGKLDQAIRVTEEAVRQARTIPDAATLADCLGNLGNYFSDADRFDESLAALNESREIARRLRDKRRERNRISDLAVLYHAVGQKEQALEFYVLAVALSETLPDQRGLMYALGNLVSFTLETAPGWLAFSSLPETRREEVWKTARACAERLTGIVPDSCVSSSRFSQWLMSDCLQKCNRALDIAMELEDWPFVARQYSERALIFRLLGKPDASLRAYRKAVEILGTKTDDARAKAKFLGDMGTLLLRIGQPDNAVSCYQEALSVGCSEPETVFMLHKQLGNAHGELSKFSDAFRHLAEAIRVREEVRADIGRPEWRESYVAEKEPVYADMVRLLCERLPDETWRRLKEENESLPVTRFHAALEYVERAKARVLVELIARDLNKATRPDGEDQVHERFLNMVQIGHRLEQCLLGHPEFLSLKSVYALSAREICTDVLGTEGILLEYFQLDPITFAVCVADASGVVFAPQPVLGFELFDLFKPRGQDGAPRKDGVVPFADEQGAYPFAGGLQGFRKAYDMLLPEDLRRALELGEPAAAKRHKRLIIVPHGLLHRLAFHALTRDGEHFLIDEFEKGIIYAPSATALWYCTQKQPSGPARSALILANSFPDDPEWEPIPSVTAEAEELARLYPSEGGRNVFLDQDATPQALAENAGKFDAVIILTHGRDVGEHDDPLSRSFVLSGGEVTVRALYALPAPATLHDYGLCFSATVTPAAGDEFVSITRGGFCAGARSILASLWGLPDHAATLFLKRRFHEAWRAEEDKGLALKKAMEETRRKWGNPLFWAHLVLAGDWR